MFTMLACGFYEESFDQRFLDLIAAFDKCGKYLYEGSLKW